MAMNKLAANMSAADLALALERETGSKIGAAWGPAPSVTRLEIVSSRAEVQEDGKPHGFLKYYPLNEQGARSGAETEREVPTWVLTRLAKEQMAKAGVKLAIGYFGMAVNAKTKAPVHDFRIIILT